eukprot:649249-Amphidinium_carterae.1
MDEARSQYLRSWVLYHVFDNLMCGRTSRSESLCARRLLAYFDDASTARGAPTLIQRIAEYQRDLTELERELLKYQAVLGSQQIRVRNRDIWIAQHCPPDQHPPSVTDRYRHSVHGTPHSDSPTKRSSRASVQKRPSQSPTAHFSDPGSIIW